MVAIEKVNPRKYLPVTKRENWAQFSSKTKVVDILGKFKELKGDPRLLRFLWDEYEVPPPKSAQSLWKKLMTGVAAIEQLRDALKDHEKYRLLGLDRHVEGLRHEVEVGLEFATLPQGKQANWDRHYWAGALVPYLDLTTRKPHWRWLTDWLSVATGASLDSTQVRLWADFIRHNDDTPKQKVPLKGSRQHVHSQLGQFFERHRRDRVAASCGALNAAVWIKRVNSDTALVERYIRKAHKRWPFFKKVLPNSSYLRKAS